MANRLWNSSLDGAQKRDGQKRECLEHESNDGGSSTGKAKTGRETRSSVGGLLGEVGGGVADGVTRGLDSRVAGRDASRRNGGDGGGVRGHAGVAAGAGRRNGGGRSNGGGSRRGSVDSRRGAAAGSSRRRRLGVALAGGDTELGAVLVLASDVVDDLETVAVGAVGDGQVGGGSPGEAAAVLDALGESRSVLDDVAGGALEEEQGDGVVGGGGPGDGERLALGDDLAKRVSLGCLLGVWAAAQSRVAALETRQAQPGWAAEAGLTSFRGRVMGLPFGSPTAAWSWAVARPKKATMAALAYMLTFVFVVVGD